MGGLENFVKILKWGGYNKRELAEKNGRKIKGPPPVIRDRRVVNSKSVLQKSVYTEETLKFI